MNSIGFIGTGHIAAPMVRFLSDRGHEVTVSNRNADVAAQLNQSHGVSVADNQSVVDTSDIVFLCVRPHIVEDVLTSIDFRPDQQIISVMAGISLKHLQAICAPATDFSLTIPFRISGKGRLPFARLPVQNPAGTIVFTGKPCDRACVRKRAEPAFRDLHHAARSA